MSFLPDPANNDILLIEWGPEGSNRGHIRRLVSGGDDSSFPQTLSATGFFADLTDLSPNPGGVAYTPNLRFWSDYANKRRWFLIRNTTDTVTYSRDGKWTFPTGMIWVKHFDLDLDRGNPVTSKRIETRFLVKTPTSVYGVCYRWNDAGTEAYLVPESGQEFDLTVTNAGVVGTQRYHIPSRAETPAPKVASDNTTFDAPTVCSTQFAPQGELQILSPPKARKRPLANAISSPGPEVIPSRLAERPRVLATPLLSCHVQILLLASSNKNARTKSPFPKARS